MRYASAGMLADDLDRWLHDEPILAEPWPRRVWRKVRRHPTLAASATLLVFFVIALVIAMMTDRGQQPESRDRVAEGRRQALLQEVASGRKVTLIPALGPPAWYRWAARDDLDTASESPDRPLAVNETDPNTGADAVNIAVTPVVSLTINNPTFSGSTATVTGTCDSATTVSGVIAASKPNHGKPVKQKGSNTYSIDFTGLTHATTYVVTVYPIRDHASGKSIRFTMP